MDSEDLRIDLGNGLELRRVRLADLREQPINAQVMQPTEYERLVENVRNRGALESVPYCAQPVEDGPIEVVSGHHRNRAAIQAGLTHAVVLVDHNLTRRSEIVAKQIAHNVLVGQQDPQLLRQLVAQITSVDDLLSTGLRDDALPSVADDDTVLATPSANFDWRTVTLTFLPHQFDRFAALIETLDGHQDLVGVAAIEAYEPFSRACGDYGRIAGVKSVGTVVSVLTEIASSAAARAAAESEAAAQEAADTAAVEDRRDGEDGDRWVTLSGLLGTARIPQASADVILACVRALEERGDIGPRNRWQAIEYACASLLAEVGAQDADEEAEVAEAAAVPA
jgi:hypothetical protein